MILFIDDESRQMESYIEELRLSGYKVEPKDNVDEALSYLEENLLQITMVILDIMMPPGKSFKNGEVEHGLRTGVKFYKRIRELSSDLQVIVLTNVSDEKIAHFFHQERNCCFLPKEEILPYQLAEEIENILKLKE